MRVRLSLVKITTGVHGTDSAVVFHVFLPLSQNHTHSQRFGKDVAIQHIMLMYHSKVLKGSHNEFIEESKSETHYFLLAIPTL